MPDTVVTVNVFAGEGCRPTPPRLLFGLGLFREQAGPVYPTPWHHRHRPFGDLLMSFQMTDSQQVTATVKAVDKKNNPITFDSAPAWATDNTDLLALAPSGDGLSCVVTAVGPLGSGVVSVKATAGGTDVAGSAQVTIVSGAPVSIEIDLGTPTDVP